LRDAIVVTSWDDGHPLDMRLAGLLEKYGIPGTFYIPIVNSEGRDVLSKEQVLEISDRFEVGGHTYNHVDLTKLSTDSAREEVFSCKNALEDMIGKEIESFCYPRGKYNDAIMGIVKEAGFKNARTVRLLEKDFKDPFQIGTTAHVTEKGLTHFTNYLIKSKGLPDRGMVSGFLLKNLLFKDWYGCASIALDHIVKEGGIFHLWGHSREIESFGQWGRLEAFLKRISMLAESGQVVLKDVSDAVER